MKTLSLLSDENVLNLVVLIVARLHEHTKMHLTDHFKWVNCISDLHLNRIVFKIN